MIKTLLGGLVLVMGSWPGYSFEFKSEGDGKVPVEIQADDGISCDQETHVCQAKGNVSISQKGVILKADRVKAHLVKIDDSHQTLSRIEATGHVSLETTYDNKRLTALEGSYDIEKGTMEFFGHPVRIQVDGGWIEANHSIYYDENKGIATATGNAKAFKDGYTMTAPVLRAHFHRTPDNKLMIKNIEADQGLRAQSSSDLLIANQGYHDPSTQKARAKGNVKLVRDNGVLVGDKAEANLKEGTGLVQGKPGTRVKLLLNPKDS